MQEARPESLKHIFFVVLISKLYLFMESLKLNILISSFQYLSSVTASEANLNLWGQAMPHWPMTPSSASSIEASLGLIVQILSYVSSILALLNLFSFFRTPSICLCTICWLGTHPKCFGNAWSVLEHIVIAFHFQMNYVAYLFYFFGYYSIYGKCSARV